MRTAQPWEEGADIDSLNSPGRRWASGSEQFYLTQLFSDFLIFLFFWEQQLNFIHWHINHECFCKFAFMKCIWMRINIIGFRMGPNRREEIFRFFFFVQFDWITKCPSASESVSSILCARDDAFENEVWMATCCDILNATLKMLPTRGYKISTFHVPHTHFGRRSIQTI